MEGLRERCSGRSPAASGAAACRRGPGSISSVDPRRLVAALLPRARLLETLAPTALVVGAAPAPPRRRLFLEDYHDLLFDVYDLRHLLLELQLDPAANNFLLDPCIDHASSLMLGRLLPGWPWLPARLCGGCVKQMQQHFRKRMFLRGCPMKSAGYHVPIRYKYNQKASGVAHFGVKMRFLEDGCRFGRTRAAAADYNSLVLKNLHLTHA